MTIFSMFSATTRHRGGTASGLLAILVVGAVAVIGLVYGLSMYADARRDAEAGPGPAEPIEVPGPVPAPAAAPAAALPPAPILFSPQVVDFGIIAPREKASAVIALRNTAAEPVKVLSMKAACKCTTLEDLTGTEIGPGATVELTAWMDGREAGATGNSEVRFVFEGYAPAKVILKAAYRRSVVAMPPYLNALEDLRSGLVQLKADDDRVFRVIAVNGAPPQYHEYDPASGELRNRYIMKWDVSGYDEDTCLDAAGNRMPQFIVFETDHPGAPIVELILRHTCNFPEPRGQRRWTPRGKHRVVGVVGPGETTEVLIPVRWVGADPPDERFEAVISETEGVDAELLEVIEVDGFTTCRVRIIPGDDLRGLFLARLRVHGTRTSAPFVVMGTVREPVSSDP